MTPVLPLVRYRRHIFKILRLDLATVVTLVSWMLWEHRNGIVFDKKAPNQTRATFQPFVSGSFVLIWSRTGGSNSYYTTFQVKYVALRRFLAPRFTAVMQPARESCRALSIFPLFLFLLLERFELATVCSPSLRT